MINTLLDNDLYKFTMMQLVWHRLRDVEVTYQLVIRRDRANLMPYYDAIMAGITSYGQCEFSADEIDYLNSLGFFSADFLAYLKTYKPDISAINIDTSDGFALTINGLWHETILFEVPMLAILSECAHDTSVTLDLGRARLQEKMATLKASPWCDAFSFSDFGTRRRYSGAWQDSVVASLQAALPKQFVGTSNLNLARRYGLKPIGTMAHEYIQAFQSLSSNILTSQKDALNLWLKEYPNTLGVALSDTLGLKKFLEDFDAELACVYSGVRQDSGDPIAWGHAMLKHYQHLGIDSKQKSFVFSDGLTFPKALQILQTFHHKVQCLFGIGTYLTHDFGKKPLDMVIKMVEVDRKPVAKISDSPGKAVCTDANYLQELITMLRL